MEAARSLVRRQESEFRSQNRAAAQHALHRGTRALPAIPEICIYGEAHARLLHPDRPELRVTVPIHSKDLPPSFLKHRVLKQAGLSEEEFSQFL